jgi:hypothetical protein
VVLLDLATGRRKSVPGLRGSCAVLRPGVNSGPGTKSAPGPIGGPGTNSGNSGKWICGDDGTITVFNADGPLFVRLNRVVPIGIALDPERQVAVMRCPEKSIVPLFATDVRTWKRIAVPRNAPKNVTARCGPAWAPNGRLAVGYDDGIRVWQSLRDPSPRLHRRPRGRCLALAYQGNRRLLVLVKPYGGPPAVWEIEGAGKARRILVLPVPEVDVRPVVFSPERRYLLTTEQRTAALLWKIPP